MRTHARRLFFAAFLLAFCHTASAFYDTNVGRWISRDPIGEEGGAHLYRFGSNEMVTAIDPLGNSPNARAERVTLDYADNGVTLGQCGHFRWDIMWNVSSRGTARITGYVYQKVTIQRKVYAAGQWTTLSPVVLNESWGVPGALRDTWSEPDWGFGTGMPCKGEITYKAEAYFARDVADTSPNPAQLPAHPTPLQIAGAPTLYPPNPAPGFADLLGPSDPPPRESNRKVRKKVVRWNCLLGRSSTSVD
jgi:hypothetical protein